jgi:hypothetical protein
MIVLLLVAILGQRVAMFLAGRCALISDRAKC